MKILIIGFLSLFGWSALSTHFYICRIKRFCNTQASTLSSVVNPEPEIPHDSLSKPPAVEHEAVRENLLIYFTFDKYTFRKISNFTKDVALTVTQAIEHFPGRI